MGYCAAGVIVFAIPSISGGLEMNMTLEILNPLDCDGWNDLLISSGSRSFFHSSEWARVLVETYRYKPMYFALVEDDSLRVLIPFMEVNSLITGRRGVSLPFTDFCEPIVDKGLQFRDALDYVIQHAAKARWKFIDFRCGAAFPADLQPSSYWYVHDLKISTDHEQIFSALKSSARRNIKKAAREGITTRISHSLSSIREFYRLNCLTRKRHGLPPQPYAFFKKIHEHIFSKNMGFVLLASYRGRDIAGAVYLHFGDKAIYKYGASDLRHQNLRPNDLVMWEAIRWFSQNGYKTLSLGRTEPENYGLRRFKSGWGAEEKTFTYYKYDVAKQAFIEDRPQVHGLHNRLFSMMPIPLLKIAGSLLYRHAG